MRFILRNPVTVNLLVPGNNKKTLLEKKNDKFLEKLFFHEMATEINDTLPVCPEAKDYPWCFVLPPVINGQKKFYTGAWINRPEGVFALYSTSNYSWLAENLATRLTLAFWQARILTPLAKEKFHADDIKSIRGWAISLQRSYSPFWERFLLRDAYKFNTQSRSLLTENCDLDYRVTEESGVDIMPWPDWPASILSGKYAWCWQQTRDGRIIDCRKIAVREA